GSFEGKSRCGIRPRRQCPPPLRADGAGIPIVFRAETRPTTITPRTADPHRLVREREGRFESGSLQRRVCCELVRAGGCGTPPDPTAAVRFRRPRRRSMLRSRRMVMVRLTRFVEGFLKLQINAEKSPVAPGRSWGLRSRTTTRFRRRCIADKAVSRFKPR